MKKTFIRKILTMFALPFMLFAVLLDESRNINEYGDWNTYHARRNSEV